MEQEDSEGRARPWVFVTNVAVYRTWKKNAPYLYDVMVARNLLWPSLTVEWFPERTVYVYLEPVS
jgi:hypothetical protein